MPKAVANGISLEYEDLGDRGAPPILLIMGLGQQLVAWPQRLLNGLIQAGFRVVCYDNRDVGLSSWLSSQSAPSAAQWVLAHRAGTDLPIPYALADMAEDACGLLNALSIPAAHIVGVSMGGMIAQHLAAKAQKRALSLTSIMSSSGAAYLPGSTPAIQDRFFGRPPMGATTAQLIERTVEFMNLISFPDPARPASAIREVVETAMQRGYNPEGYNRQLLAVIADPSRIQMLQTIAVPTLVIHGVADQLVPVACGIDSASHIPAARLEIIEHMAHGLPPSQINRIFSLIAEHACASHASHVATTHLSERTTFLPV